MDRAKTPWVVFAGHRPYLVSSICSGWSGASGPNARAATLGKALEEALEPVFERHQVNLALWGHVHDYERTCPVRRRKCIAPGAAGADGGTTHAIIGNAGHGVHSTLNSSGFITGCGMWVLPEPDWIAFRAFEHGYARLTAHNASSLHFQAVMNRDRAVHDDFWLHRTPGLKSDEAQYELYRPKIERSFVLDTHSSPLQYNHDATIAFFANTWFALWNAGRKCSRSLCVFLRRPQRRGCTEKEGVPPQFNAMSTSADLKRWSQPVRAFSDEAFSANPVACDSATCVQWQPNLFLLADGRLGCVWSANIAAVPGSWGTKMATYFSVLSSWPGKWTNHRLGFGQDNSPEPLVDGVRWSLFASQNPLRLPSGRILAPVVMTGGAPPDAPASCSAKPAPPNASMVCQSRRASVLISDSHGATWSVSAGTSIAAADWAVWEPTVWAPTPSSSEVYLIARWNKGRVADQRMQWAKSTDSGSSFSPLRALPLDTVVSRMQVMPQAAAAGGTARFLMVMNDADGWKSHGSSGRVNVALFLSPSGPPPVASVAFAPGVGLSEHGEIAMYPQMWQVEKKLVVVYSSGDAPRGIRVASLLLPTAGKHMVAVRNNSQYFVAHKTPRGEEPSVVTEASGAEVLRLCRFSSASLELPPVSCLASGPGLRLQLAFRLRRPTATTPATASAPDFTVATVGDGQAHARLVASPKTGDTVELRLMCATNGNETASVAVSLASLNAWTTLELVTSPGGRLSVNGSAPLRCGSCASGGPVWAFLGEGFLHRHYHYSSGCVDHDLAALRSSSISGEWMSNGAVATKSDDPTAIHRTDAAFASVTIDSFDKALNAGQHCLAPDSYDHKKLLHCGRSVGT